jgi:hypothetical protein
LSSNFRQIRPIVDGESLLRRDIEVRDQCVPFGGDASNEQRTRAAHIGVLDSH